MSDAEKVLGVLIFLAIGFAAGLTLGRGSMAMSIKDDCRNFGAFYSETSNKFYDCKLRTP